MIGTLAFSYDTTDLGGFVANHDIPRPRSFVKDSSLLSNLFSYSFISDGIPIFYSGDETDNAVGGETSSISSSRSSSRRGGLILLLPFRRQLWIQTIVRPFGRFLQLPTM